MSAHMLCHGMPCYAMLCHVMSCYVMLCYAMLCYVMLCYVMLCYVMLCYDMIWYVMICYVMLYHIISYHVIAWHWVYLSKDNLFHFILSIHLRRTSREEEKGRTFNVNDTKTGTQLFLVLQYTKSITFWTLISH